MKVPVSWLREYVSFELPVEERHVVARDGAHAAQILGHDQIRLELRQHLLVDRVQRSAEMRAEGVAVVAPQRHLDHELAKVRRDRSHADARSGHRGPQVHAPAKKARRQRVYEGHRDIRDKHRGSV